jgi:hypothetical protein
MNIEEFDRFLAQEGSKPDCIFVSPIIWTGYWGVHSIFPVPIRKLFRKIGRKLHSRYIYWLGFPIYWVVGLEEIISNNYKRKH